MYKALILTYYFPPFNGVPGYRPYSWYKHFSKSNIKPTVICRHWKGDEKLWEDSIKENNSPIIVKENKDSCLISIPYIHSNLKKVSDSSIFKIKWISKIYHLFLLLSGRLSIEIDADFAYKKYLNAYLKNNRFDMVIVSTPPHNLIRLGYYISKKYKIPLVVDFRDLWDNDELKKNYKPTFSQAIKNKLTKFYLKKWLKKAEFITTVSSPLAEKIKTITTREVIEITNGFEQEMFLNKNDKPSTQFFTISVIGTLYPKQDISIIINGLQKFLLIVGTQKVKLNFIGIEAIKSISDEIKSKLAKECIFISHRLPRETAISYTLKSHILLYAGWKNYQGIYSGKIFDYLGARRNILIAPGDNDVIDNIIRKSNSGKIANSIEEFCSYLTQWYYEWEQNGELSYNGKENIINYYTRENQTKIFAEHILSKIDKLYSNF